MKDAFGEVSDEGVADPKSLTVAEIRMVEIAREASTELSCRFGAMKACLSLAQQVEISSGVDVAIAAGLRSLQRRDRATAAASRILMQTLTIQDERLIGERSAEQCRALMYEAGMV